MKQAIESMVLNTAIILYADSDQATLEHVLTTKKRFLVQNSIHAHIPQFYFQASIYEAWVEILETLFIGI